MRNNRRFADIVDGEDSPLNAAVSQRDRSILDAVAQAVRHGQTMLAYQPILQSTPPHEVAFYEGLIRIPDETGRIIPAGQFLPFVEDSDLGRQIDCSALALGLRMLKSNPGLRLSINMSARSIGYKRWSQILNRALRQDETLGERLMLELTESSVMLVPEIVADFMASLQGRGIAFALDDFGSGRVAFRHFREFLFDAVKIDGQFIRNVHRNPDNQSLTRALIAVAREFEMLVVAESVESEAEAEFLVSHGVECLQGYLFGPPTIRPPWLQSDTGSPSAA